MEKVKISEFEKWCSSLNLDEIEMRFVPLMKQGWLAALKWVLTDPDIRITRAKSSKIIMQEIAANEKE